MLAITIKLCITFILLAVTLGIFDLFMMGRLPWGYRESKLGKFIISLPNYFMMFAIILAAISGMMILWLA